MNDPRTALSGNSSVRTLTAAAAAFVATLLVLLFAAAALTGAQPAREGAVALVRTGAQLIPNNANARASGDAMVVANRPDAPLTVLATGTLPLRASDYSRVAIEAEPLPRHVEVALIWVRRDEPGRPHELPLALDGDRIVATALDAHPGWTGEIGLVAVGVKGVGDRPWTVRAFRLEPPGIAGAAGDIVRGWTAFAAWDGRSINVLFGGREEQRAWLPPIVFAATVLSTLVVWWLARRRGVRATPLALALPFLAGWLLLDLRWQDQLLRQAHATWADYAGRTWEQRHLAMDDGELFRFAQAAIARMPQEPVRVFATSDFEYFRRRAGYHLYPHNVLAYDWADPAVLRPGDYLFLYQKADVRYDTGRRMLLWASGPTLPVTPVVVQRGAGVFVVREPEAKPQ
jgi:hypothetical protein